MHEVRADTASNVLYIELTGRMDLDETQKVSEEALEEAEKLGEAFHVINDISGFSPPSPDVAKPIKETQRQLVSLGVDRVIRVSDEETSSVVTNAFERRSRDVGYSGETASSVSEAEAALQEKSVQGYASKSSA